MENNLIVHNIPNKYAAKKLLLLKCLELGFVPATGYNEKYCEPEVKALLALKDEPSTEGGHTLYHSYASLENLINYTKVKVVVYTFTEFLRKYGNETEQIIYGD